ncbi:glycosyltransferase [Methylocella silvestris]|uniref:Histidine kinase n=1 Tax=Methylocella silvestris TaxID=199596 RepID=A0A2J7TDA0_METSI|nr:glycosyltransferase [Methylocella silvestris]PNG24747.1 histidine kinase [Methylocella silvestris]
MWLIAFVLFLSFLLLQHPFVTYPLSLYGLRLTRGPRSILKADECQTLSVDIVFCAYNEINSIGSKIENCLKLKEADPGLQIRAYSDGSSDGSADLLAQYSSKMVVTISDRRLGKSAGMNTLLAQSSADIVVFTDANTTIDDRAIDSVRRYFSDAQVGCVCGDLRYVNARESPTAGIGSAYWRFEQLLKALETSTGSTMGSDGALFAIRRKLFTPVPVDIIDDMFTSLSILCDGYRVVQADDFIAYERSVTRSGEEWRRKVRIACRAFNCHRLLWPRLRRTGALNIYKYISHKWVRWLSGLWIIAAGASLLTLLALAGLWWIGAFFILAAAAIITAGRCNLFAGAAALNEILISLFAATYGVWKSLRGQRFQTWSVASTARAGN